MPIPSGVLTPDEVVMLDIRPHWVSFVVRAATAGLAVVVWLLTVVLLHRFFVVVATVALAAALIRLAVVLVPWWFTCFAVTSERVIVRKGVIAQHGVEIPLDRINTVFFEQSVVERLVGAGDLIVESASEQGRQVFHDIAHPNEVQQVVYQAKEQLQAREHQRQGAAIAKEFGPSKFTQPNSIGFEVRQLWTLCQSGAITQHEYETLKARLINPEA